MNMVVCSITTKIRGAPEGIRHAWMTDYRKVEIQLDSLAVVAILIDKSLTISHSY
ncbi:hypothetical protein LINPERHAP2_LOCUS32023 [Linum perenne]